MRKLQTQKGKLTRGCLNSSKKSRGQDGEAKRGGSRSLWLEVPLAFWLLSGIFSFEILREIAEKESQE